MEYGQKKKITEEEDFLFRMATFSTKLHKSGGLAFMTNVTSL